MLLVAGEASGDQHAAHLVEQLRQQHPEWSFVGFGGPAMHAAGVDLRVDLVDNAVMGIRKVIGAIGSIIDIAALFWEEIRRQPPDLVILVDYPGLNLNLARMAKRRSIPVVYYIVPQVWAWGPWRIRRVARRADLLLVILPFEKSVYGEQNARVEYVGNPLYEELRAQEAILGGPRTEESLAGSRTTSTTTTTVALFPGSRVHEVEETLPTMLRIARRLVKEQPHLQFKVSCHRSKLEASIDACLEEAARDGLNVEKVMGDSRALQREAIFSLVVSGTITLEHAFFMTPMVILYAVTPWEKKFFRWISVTPFIGLANLVAGKRLAPEFLYVPQAAAPAKPARPKAEHDEFAEFSADEAGATEAALTLLDEGKRVDQHRQLRALREECFGVEGVRQAAAAVSRFAGDLQR